MYQARTVGYLNGQPRPRVGFQYNWSYGGVQHEVYAQVTQPDPVRQIHRATKYTVPRGDSQTRDGAPGVWMIVYSTSPADSAERAASLQVDAGCDGPLI